MMTCLTNYDLQGYLEESGSTPLRRTVEQHLVSCAHCRTVFDRVVATHQRVNAWLSELASPADDGLVNVPAALTRLMSRIEAVDPECGHLSRLLAPALMELPWYASLFGNLRDLIRPQKLPPLALTSKPVAVKSIWGLYGSNPASRYISLAIHCAAFVLLMIGVTNTQVRQTLKQTAILIDPTLRPYEAPSKKNTAGGGGGGGAREAAPVTKGQAPRPSLKQFTPPMVVQEPPKLAMMPTIVAPPDTVLPQNDLPNYGDPLARLADLSNGSGFDGGMGSGSGGGLGSGKGGGFGPGAGGGFGGGVFRVGGGVSQPAVVSKIDPEYSEEARKAKYSGTVILAVVVDTEGRARDIHVVRSLGMGLDEKAIEAVAKWKFRPGMKDGQPVNVRATIQVDFRLL